ncbi:nucleotidyltransferase domain-containing protein [Staphylococcus xylosus]|uniref:nucleotidyltransferase domain-containing protein n=1 Tax=Staphylococcus xylosus TaxID=1288 RepID=UPI000E68EEEE|nr:nucleotidyltransferase domain-containing protein [Staphylococcus xylosus]RIM63166.1 hypothetical protein BU122_13655 [Staphylococcus xylosus]
MNNYQKKYQNQIKNYVNRNKSILAAFYGGSISRNDSDIYSDIDFRIVLNENIEKGFALKEFINIFQNKLFIEHQNNDFAVFHLTDLMKVDVFVYYQKDIGSNIWLNDIKILKDYNGFLEALKNQSMNESVAINRKRLEVAQNKYLAYLLESYKREARTEYYYTYYAINMMTNILCYLWYLDINEEPNSIGDWSKYQGERSKLSINQLNILKTLPSNNSSEQRNILNDEFIKVINNIIDKENMSFSLDNKKLIKFINSFFKHCEDAFT